MMKKGKGRKVYKGKKRKLEAMKEDNAREGKNEKNKCELRK